jgi:hypothetical protein
VWCLSQPLQKWHCHDLEKEQPLGSLARITPVAYLQCGFVTGALVRERKRTIAHHRLSST